METSVRFLHLFAHGLKVLLDIETQEILFVLAVTSNTSTRQLGELTDSAKNRADEVDLLLRVVCRVGEVKRSELVLCPHPNHVGVLFDG